MPRYPAIAPHGSARNARADLLTVARTVEANVFLVDVLYGEDDVMKVYLVVAHDTEHAADCVLELLDDAGVPYAGVDVTPIKLNGLVFDLDE